MSGLTNFFVILLTWCAHFHTVFGVPEKDNCDDVPSGKIIKIRDLSDCQKFYYCYKGLKKPYQGSCPYDEAAGVHLYFNPQTSSCELARNAPQGCIGSEGKGDRNDFIAPRSEPQLTTEFPFTTTKSPRPPKLDDKNGLIIDCRQKGCGIFPNTYGSCNTYVMCINGEKVVKKCNAGQLFDVITQECQIAQKAKCWAEPNAGPHVRTRKLTDCPPHKFTPTPIETLQDGMVLHNPIVTNEGTWQSWMECPAGRYATGVNVRRMLLYKASDVRDHVGIISLSFLCQTPGGTENDTHINGFAPNTGTGGWPSYYMCSGAVVGFRLNSGKPEGWNGDKIGTDNVQAMCSCSGPAFKPYDNPIYAPQNGHRGIWTQPQYCGKYQAVCGMQTQMLEFQKDLAEDYDNTGLNNMKVKCCDVPDPLVTCEATEEREFIRTCDNLNNEEFIRCDFESVVGHSMDLSNPKLMDFYSGIGYTFQYSKGNITKIQLDLKEQMESGNALEYTWDDIADPAVDGGERITLQKLFIRPGEKHDLYQVVGKCGHFLIRSNRYVRIITDGSQAMREEIFEV